MTADFRLGTCIVRSQRRIIERGDESFHVRPKAMAVFECLLAAGGEPVSRGELFDTVWPGSEVTDDTLTKCIVELRKALGDSAHEPRVIETIPKLGFRLIPAPEPLEAEQAVAEERPTDRGRRRWLRPGRLLTVAAVVVLAAALLYPGARLWLTEAGVTLFMKAAAVLVPYSLEKKPGIAVLPFVNIGGDAENEYFSDGMSAEVLSALTRTRRLPVIARSSSFQFKGDDRDVREIGRLLGVSHVLEGSVRRAGEGFRMTVQLIETSTGAHLWSGIFQGKTGDVFAVQEEIAGKIANQVSAVLDWQIDVAPGGDVAAKPEDLPVVGFMRARPPANPEAYDQYLKGMAMLTSERPALIEQAAGQFDRAIALEPDYADAWAARGYALMILGHTGSGSPRIPASVYPGAIAAFRRALEIEPEHAFALGWLGVTLMLNDFKWAEGMQLLEQSVARDPNNADLLAVYGFYLGVLQLEGKAEVVDRAYRLDPFGFTTITQRASLLQRRGRLLEAASLAETVLIDDPEGYGPNFFSATFNLAAGRLDAAEANIGRARQVANPQDLQLDAIQSEIDRRRGRGPSLSSTEVWERMQTERLSWVVIWPGWNDEKLIEETGLTEESIVAIFDLAIEQRHEALRAALFGPKPLLMPEAEWQRMREITGVTQYLANRQR